MEKKKASKVSFKFFRNWNYKYKLVVMNESTFEEKLNYRLSRMNVFVSIVLFTLTTFVITFFIIRFTPLKELIPNYGNVEQIKMIYENDANLDSLEREAAANEKYMDDFKKYVLLGEDPASFDSTQLQQNPDIDYQNVNAEKTTAEKSLVNEFENEAKYDLIYYDDEAKKEIYHYLFFPPLKGTVTNGFNYKKKHLGIDIVAEKDQTVMATLDGVVMLSSWTYETGYIIVIQHNQNLVSIYKHNSKLLKQDGDFVKSGEAIAFCGNTGELTTGPHLHFELWYKGNAVNPAEFISFE